MVKEFEADRDPGQTMNVLQAIRWGVSTWTYDVTMKTVEHCWLKSRVLGPKCGPATEEEAMRAGYKHTVQEMEPVNQSFNTMLVQMQATLTTLHDIGYIRDAMQISRFLNPVEEQIVDADEDILEQVVGSYSVGLERGYETDEEEVTVPPVKMKEAIAALQTLRLYEEQPAECDQTLLRHLDKQERAIKARGVIGMQQQSITNFFS